MARTTHELKSTGVGVVEAYPVTPTPKAIVPVAVAVPQKVLVEVHGGTVVGRYGALLARLLICPIFLMSGIHKLTDWNKTQGFLEKESRAFFDWMNAPPALSSNWMSAIPVLLAVAVAFEILGGLSVLTGFKARLGAFALFLFLIPTTLIFHSFWRFPQSEQELQMIMFMKNVTIMGGPWMIMSFGPGLLSFDARKLRCVATPA